MYKVLQIFESLPESAVNEDLVNEFVQSCKEQESFCSENISASSSNFNAARSLVSFLKIKLNSSEEHERLVGLHLLHGFTWNACAEEQWVENQLWWMSQCVRGIEPSAPIETNIVAYNALGRLLDIAVRFGGMSKEMNTIVVAKFVERATKANPQVMSAAVRCLATLMKHYGAALSSHRIVLERFILKFADCHDPVLISTAAQCFVHLTQLGGPGVKGTNHESRWLDHENRTLSSMDSLLGQLFEHVVETHGSQRDDINSKLALEMITEVEPLAKVRGITTRLINLCLFLETMLLDNFPVAKTVEVDRVIRIVSRGLSVNCAVVCNQASSELLAVGSSLPRVQVALYRVLASIITCLESHLLPYGSTICHLAMQTLQWTGTDGAVAYGIARPRSKLRRAAYGTLTAWLKTVGAASCMATVADKLVAEAMADVYNVKPAVKLNAQPGKKGKKLRKQLASEEASSSAANRERLYDVSANHETCKAALDALYWLVHSVGTELSASVHKSLQETVVTTLLEVQRGLAPIPYARSECLVALYSLLGALTMRAHATWPPPTQHALYLLAVGARHQDHRVAEVCTVTLSSVKSLVEPSCQPLTFPASLLEMRSSVNLPSEADDEMDQTDVTLEAVEESKPSKPVHPVAAMTVVPTPEQGDEDVELVDLSSEDEADLMVAQSNVSVASSNSNYQDLVLNNSADVVANMIDTGDIVSPTKSPMLTKSPARSPTKSMSKEVIQEVTLDDENVIELVLDDDCEIVGNELKSPERKKAKEPLTNGKASEDLEGMNEDEFITMALGEFIATLK